MGLSSSSLSQLQMPVKNNHASSIDMSLGAYPQIGFDDEDNESSIESSLRSASQMSMSAFSSNSNNPIRKIDHLNMKLEAVMSSHRMLQFKAQARLTTHGVDSSQYKNYVQKIEEKRMEIISINQRIEYKRSLMNAEYNPTMPSSKNSACQLLHLADDRMQIPSGITDNRGQLFKDSTISLQDRNIVLQQRAKKNVHQPVEDTASRRRYRMLLRRQEVVWICQLPLVGVFRPLAQVKLDQGHFHRGPRLTKVVQGLRVRIAPG